MYFIFNNDESKLRDTAGALLAYPHNSVIIAMEGKPRNIKHCLRKF